MSSVLIQSACATHSLLRRTCSTTLLVLIALPAGATEPSTTYAALVEPLHTTANQSDLIAVEHTTRSTLIATEATAPLTLDAALDLALKANPDLLAAQHEARAIEGTVIQAGIRPNPDIAASMEDFRKATRTTTVQLNQALELGGKRAARIGAAEQARDAAYADFAVKRAEIRAVVIAAFFDLLTAQERISLAQSSVELSHRATTVAYKRVFAGKVSPVEETKARVAEANVRLELNQAKSELAMARQRLAANWGDAHPGFANANGQLETLPALPALTDLAERIASAPALSRARIEVYRRMALAEVEKTRRTPNVTVSVGVKRAEDLGRTQAIVGLSIPLPLFDRNQGNLIEALRRTDKAHDELLATEVRVNTDITQAYGKFATARQAVDALQQEILPGAQSAYDAATKGFEFGKFNFLDVLDAQRTLLQAKSQYLRALSDAHRAAAEIEGILGVAAPVRQSAKH